MSDHNFIIVNSSIDLDEQKDDVQSDNIYDTNLLDFDLLGASEDEWTKISNSMKLINWEEELNDKDVNDRLVYLINSLE